MDVDVKEPDCEDRCDLTGGGKRRTSDVEGQSTNAKQWTILECKFTLGLTCLPCLTLDVNVGPWNVSGPDAGFVASN